MPNGEQKQGAGQIGAREGAGRAAASCAKGGCSCAMERTSVPLLMIDMLPAPGRLPSTADRAHDWAANTQRGLKSRAADGGQAPLARCQMNAKHSPKGFSAPSRQQLTGDHLLRWLPLMLGQPPVAPGSASGQQGQGVCTLNSKRQPVLRTSDLFKLMASLAEHRPSRPLVSFDQLVCLLGLEQPN